MLIQTTKGMIEESELEYREVRSETDNSKCIAMEWWHNGELVRRDAWANILRGQAIAGEQTTVG